MRNILGSLFVFLFVLVSFQKSFSLVDLSTLSDIKSDETYNYPDYYQIKEDPRIEKMNLLYFLHIEEKFPQPSVPYNRKNHFGTWIHDSRESGCLNTRGKVLIRDSKADVAYTANGCSITKGDWADPYSAQEFQSASDIQIDHFVPLKNAYMTGAYEWDYNKRCLYANYLGNNFHLLAVSGHENIAKSDSTPSGYVPPNQNYTCQYLKQWLEVKAIWTLRLTPKEMNAIKTKVAEANCNPDDFILTTTDLKRQRAFMQDQADLCTHAASTSDFIAD